MFVVYIQEAHPTDGWTLPLNEQAGIAEPQPRTAEERQQVAQTCALRLRFSIPTLLDDMHNTTDTAYAALPDRLYLIERDGRIAYRSEPGPWGFTVEDLEAAVERCLGARCGSSRPLRVPALEPGTYDTTASPHVGTKGKSHV